MKILTLLLLSLSLSSASASERAPINFKIPDGALDEIHQVSMSPKGVVRLNYSDGRTGVLSRPKKDVTPLLKINAEFVENTCAEKQKRINCTYTQNSAFELASILWEKHFDTTKVGKSVRGKNNGDSVVDYTNIYFWEHKKKLSSNPLLSQGITPRTDLVKKKLINPYIECDDFGDVKNLLNSSENTIEEWTAESNETNVETGLNENLMAAVFYNVRSRFQGDKLFFEEIGYTPPVYERGSLIGFSFADIIGWSVRTPKKMCEVSLKVDKAAILNNLMALISFDDSAENIPFEGIKNIEDFKRFFKRDFEENPSYGEYKDAINSQHPGLYDKILILDGLGLIYVSFDRSYNTENIETVVMQLSAVEVE